MTGSVILGPHEASVNRQMHLPSEGTRSRCWSRTDVLAEEPLIGRAGGRAGRGQVKAAVEAPATGLQCGGSALTEQELDKRPWSLDAPRV
jgi:hypothetical protein